ncbi:MAG: site-specific integrase [Nitrospirae bacterium]|nr:site-specific integrase [Nitrospirota bacterium]
MVKSKVRSKGSCSLTMRGFSGFAERKVIMSRKAKRDGLYKRKGSDNWYVSYVDYVDGKPTRYQLSTGTTDEAEAQKMLDEAKKKGRLGLWHPEKFKQPKPEYTFSQLVEKYSDFASARNKGWEKVEKFLVGQLNNYFGKMFLSDISTEQIEQWQNAELARIIKPKSKKPTTELKPERKPKPESINRPLTTLKTMLTKAVEWKMLDKDIRAEIKVKALKVKKKGRVRTLTVDEMSRLLSASDGYLKLIIITGLVTGLRRANYLCMRWDKHIDMDNRQIYFDGDEMKSGKPFNLTMPDVVYNLFKSIPRTSNYVFESPKKKGEALQRFDRSLRTACKKAGLVGVTAHILRHTFASHLVMAGVPMQTVAELMAHEDVKTTKIYAHLSPHHKSEALSIIGNIVESSMAANDNQNAVVLPDYYRN